ncbi:protein ALWAYS EARLY 2-like isoform X2 [Amaranthus tricolor]|uniref:protein ALWAYS EARLY 2-like isoform X2 n=1 Tax=Amaranthus tricolor TaxID=29722 RepID=UPI00258D4EDF|nr:protein ALWAYS EARLY 2-like isoform X2 [Amaranthus tricolor]
MNWVKGSKGIIDIQLLVSLSVLLVTAYLSLPEGTASVHGFKAMMIDHYNALEGSDSEKDTKEPEVIARKFKKIPKTKVLVDSSRDDAKRKPAGSSHGCLSLLKKQDIFPHIPVKKRTPRILVSLFSNKKFEVAGTNAIEDRSQTANKKIGHMRTLQVSDKEELISPFLAAKGKNGVYAAPEESKEDRLGRNVAKIGNLARDSVHPGTSALAAEYKNGQKRKKEEVQQSEALFFDNIQKKYDHSDRGTKRNNYDGKHAKVCESNSEGPRKKSKKLIMEDELAACDALQTLAEISAMMPYIAKEPVKDAGESMIGRDTTVNLVARSNVTLSNEKVKGESNEKHNQASNVNQKAESLINCSRKSSKNETAANEEVKSADSSGKVSGISIKCKSSHRSPHLSLSNDSHSGDIEAAVSSTQMDTAGHIIIPTKKSRRKRDRTSHFKDTYNAPNGCSGAGLPVLQNKLEDVEGMLLHCLSWPEARRWCVYEWFYSAIDYPWFAKRDFMEYLNHAGLGHIPRLTRAELGIIRGSLGKPRRFSKCFLQQQRERLNYYRESVRDHYVNFRAGLGEVPTDLLYPLRVGQQVVAIHPKTRDCHNGKVLSVQRDKCLVQFHCPDLGVEVVLDIDCMPLNLLENMPEAMRRERMQFDHRHIQVSKVNGSIVSAPMEHMMNVDPHLSIPPRSLSTANDIKVKPSCSNSLTKVAANGSIKTQSATQNQSCSFVKIHSQEGYMKNVPEFKESLDTKVHDRLNACSENLPLNSVGLNGKMHSSHNSSLFCLEIASNVADIVEDSRKKALKMVDTAIKEITSKKEVDDKFGRDNEALDRNGKAECASNCGISITMSSNEVQGSLPHKNPIISCSSDPQLACDMISSQSAGDSDLEIPSDLITSCIATLLMIQTCTERQHPPAEVAQILDNAATSLHPCCPQNLSIYRDIQMCMGIIKTQILALVPT